MKTATLLAIILFVLVAAAHVLRLAMSLQVYVENYPVPMWVSLIGVVVPGAVAFMLFRESRKNSRNR